MGMTRLFELHALQLIEYNLTSGLYYKNIMIARMKIVSVSSLTIIILTTRGDIYAPRVISYAPREHL
jgi:hypothetical protein